MNKKSRYTFLWALTAVVLWGRICDVSFRWPLSQWLDMTGWIVIMSSLIFTSIDNDF